jgi:fibro-slime domain-containing protein
MLKSRGRRLWSHGVLGSLVLVAAGASCSSPKQYDDDDNGGASGDKGIGGTAASATGGSSKGGKGSGATGAGGDVTGSGGSNVNAGSDTGATGGDVATTGGSPATGGDGSSATGGNGATGGDVVAGGGVNDGGAAGDCTGPDCGCTGAGCPVCGDAKVEGSEGCDDGNTLPFDGCSDTCQVEPDCTGGNCQGTCGDGIVSGEDCDDGNTKDGDGCSSTCTVESGYTCTAAECDKIGGTCVLRLPAVFRDFNGHAVSGGHPDFEPGFNSAGALQGLVEDLLDSDGKPVQTTAISAATLETQAFMHGQAAFAQWYRDDAPSSGPIPGQIVLWDDGAGGYVNRWGKNGEQWIAYPSTTYSYCEYGCDMCPPGPGQICQDQCSVFGTPMTYACLVDEVHYDGTPLFFPIDSVTGLLTEPRTEGKVPEQYGSPGWPWESAVATQMGITTPIATSTATFPSKAHNFNFTTEVKFLFRYDTTQTQSLSFLGDDDVWVFLNGHLAVDLGGWHVPLDGTLTLAGGTVSSVVTVTPSTVTPTVKSKTAPDTDFGLEDGKLYQIAVFHAERQVEGSSFKLGLRGVDLSRSTCVKN